MAKSVKVRQFGGSYGVGLENRSSNTRQKSLGGAGVSKFPEQPLIILLLVVGNSYSALSQVDGLGGLLLSSG